MLVPYVQKNITGSFRVSKTNLTVTPQNFEKIYAETWGSETGCVAYTFFDKNPKIPYKFAMQILRNDSYRVVIPCEQNQPSCHSAKFLKKIYAESWGSETGCLTLLESAAIHKIP